MAAMQAICTPAKKLLSLNTRNHSSCLLVDSIANVRGASGSPLTAALCSLQARDSFPRAAARSSSATSSALELRGGFFSPLPRRALAGALLSVVLLGKPAPANARASSSQMEKVLKDVTWPPEWPFKEQDFQRYDESSDALFYASPRFVTHIDDYAISALTKYYATVFPPPNTPGTAVLDLCSSWISHYPKNFAQEKVVGLGLNEEELKRNPILTNYVVQDLNANPKLPFEDNTFDVITNAVSVDYLTRPLEVFREMQRVLKPGGLCAMSFSNRCFFTKAISIWTSTGDADHIFIVGAYFHFAGGFEHPQAVDISPNPGRTDPMYVVYSTKLEA